jgi:hypothetical protein
MLSSVPNTDANGRDVGRICFSGGTSLTSNFSIVTVSPDVAGVVVVVVVVVVSGVAVVVVVVVDGFGVAGAVCALLSGASVARVKLAKRPNL